MKEQLENSFAILGARYRASGLPTFFDWWFAELRPLIPARVKQWFYVPSEKLLLRTVEGQLELWHASETGQRRLDSFAADTEPVQAGERIFASMDEFEEGQPIAVYCLPADVILRKTLRLPVAAEANLQQAVMFEIDRQTPFAARDVYYDVKVLQRDPPFLDVELLVVLRREADAFIERAEGLGLKLHSMDVDQLVDSEVQGSGPQPEHVNLLPVEKRARKANKRVLLNWLLVAVVVILLGLLMAETLYLRNVTLTKLEEQRDSLRAEALAVNKLKQELEDSLSAANFLASQRREVPMTLDVLAEATYLLPEHTWVQRLQINQTELQLQGLSDSAQQLVELINNSDAFDETSFKGAISTDQRLNKERFTSASIIDPGVPYVAPDTDALTVPDATGDAGAIEEESDNNNLSEEEGDNAVTS